MVKNDIIIITKSGLIELTDESTLKRPWKSKIRKILAWATRKEAVNFYKKFAMYHGAILFGSIFVMGLGCLSVAIGFFSNTNDALVQAFALILLLNFIVPSVVFKNEENKHPLTFALIFITSWINLLFAGEVINEILVPKPDDALLVLWTICFFCGIVFLLMSQGFRRY